MTQGELSAKTFAIPQYQDFQAPNGNEKFNHIEPYDDGLKPENGLQYVQGQTADYYRKVANLKSFMQDAHTNFGVDVRIPDAAKGPMSIKLNELYNNALADIMAQGNLLKNSHGTMSNLVNQGAHFFGNPNEKPADTLQLGKDYTYERIEPFVKEINDSMEKAHYGGDYKEAKVLREKALSHYDKLIEEHPNLASEYQRQKDAIMNPREGVFRPQTNWQERLWNKKVEQGGSFINDIVHLANGAREGYDPDPNKLTKEGKPMLVNNEFAGTPVGQTPDGKPIVIVHWEMNPDTRNVDLVLSDGQKLNGRSDTGTIMRMIGRAKASNSGVDVGHMEEWLVKNGLQTSTSEVDQPKIMEGFGGYNKKEKKPYWLLKQEENIEKANKSSEEMVGPAKEALHNQLSDLKSPKKWLPDMFGGAGDSIDLGGYEIENQGDGFEIKNLKNKLPNLKTKGEQQNYWLQNHHFKTIEELEGFLIKHGVHMSEYMKNKMSGQLGTEVAPSKDNTDPLGILK